MTTTDKYVAMKMTMRFLSEGVGFTVKPVGIGFEITCPDSKLLVSLHEREEKARANELSVLASLILNVPIKDLIKDT